MTTKSYSRSPLSGIKGRDGLGTPKDEVMGVLGALETVCELESRLRLAIKSTHPLDSTNWDFDQADRERKALLNLGQQLEFLEDKLRELRFVSQDKASQEDMDDQKSVLLGQLDAVRKELVEAAYAAADKVVYGKDLLKDIINFALADDEENRLATPGQGRGPLGGRFSVENTPKGKRTPAVPDSLENSYGRISMRRSPGSSAGRSERSGRPPRPDSNYSNHSLQQGTPTAGAGGAGGAAGTSRWTEDEHRKYSSFSRTLMVSDEDIYGPKAGAERFRASPDSQKYGGTVKVKELLAKAERGLTEVSSAQKGRRATTGGGVTGMGATAPRVIHDDAEYNGEAWMDQDLIDDEFDSSHTQFAAPVADKPRKAFSATPTSQRMPVATNGHAKEHRERVDSRARRADLRRSSSSGGGGLLGAISKLAGLAVVAGGLAAGAVLVSQSAKSEAVVAMPKASKTLKKSSSSKKKSKSSRKSKATPAYRGEADIYTADMYADASEDTVYFEEHSSDGPQSPVVNVHRPPATTHFPAASPDVSVAMG